VVRSRTGPRRHPVAPDPCITPLRPPNLGTVTVTDQLQVRVAVSSFPPAQPESYVARVEYAVSSTEPPPNSGEWRFVAELQDPGTAVTAPVSSGSRVWIRARGQAPGFRHSTWTSGGFVDAGDLARFRNVTLEGDTVSWTGNAQLAGVRVRWDIHDPDTLADFQSSEDLAAGAGSWTLPGTLPVGQRLTVQVQAWDDFYAGAVAGTQGQAVELSRVRASQQGFLPAFGPAGQPVPIGLQELGGWSVPAWRANGQAAHVPATVNAEIPALLADGTPAFIPVREA
jgi:hypothetical protein